MPGPVQDASTPAATTITPASTSATTAAFSPPAATLLVAFLSVQAASSGTAQSVLSVSNSGTGLTWNRRGHSNHSGSAPGGCVEVWEAYNPTAQTGITVTANFAAPAGVSGDVNDGVMAVKVFTGAATSLATAASTTQVNTTAGLVTGSITTTAANSWVWGVALNWSNSTSPTAGTSQTIVDLVRDTTNGDEGWTQKQNAVTPSSGTVVTINCTAPTGQTQLVVIEILASTGVTPAPTVTGVSPNSGSTAGGTVVGITGTNFTGATSVHFGTTAVTPTVNSATSITATAPAHAAGTVDVTVITAGGTSATSAADQFTFNAPTSTTLPAQPTAIHVEIAWSNNALDNPASYFWQDMTAMCQEFHTKRGRQHELDRVEAGTLTLILDNRESLFNAWNTASPYASGGSSVDVGHPIRIWTVEAGTSYYHFQGFITKIKHNWADPLEATVEITAEDAFRGLNFAAVPGPYETQITTDLPIQYFRFKEAGGTASDSSGAASPINGVYNGGNPNFAVSPLDEAGAVSVDMAGTDNVDASTAASLTYPFTIECWTFVQGPGNASSGTANEAVIASQGGGYFSAGWVLSYNVVSDQYFFRLGTFGFTVSTPAGSIGYNAWHHVVVIVTGSVQIYVDDVLVASVTNSQAAPPAGQDVVIGAGVIGASGSPTVYYNGLIAEWALYNYALTSTQVANHYNASSSRSGELSGRRIAWALGLANWPNVAENLMPGLTALGPLQSATTVLSHILDVVASEPGYCFVAGNGVVTFYDKSYMPAQSSVITFSDNVTGSNIPYLLPRTEVARDDLDIANDVSIIPVNNSESSSEVLASQTAYFKRSLQQYSLAPGNAGAAAIAGAWTSAEAFPLDRVRTVVVDATSNPAAVFPIILARELFQVATFQRTKFPGSTVAFTQTCVIEGIEIDWVPGYWSHTFRLSPKSAEGPMASSAQQTQTVVQAAAAQASVTAQIQAVAATVPVVQAGSTVVTFNAGGDGTITFPTNFPVACDSFVLCNGDATVSVQLVMSAVTLPTTTSVNVHCVSSSTAAAFSGNARVNWIAVGH